MNGEAGADSEAPPSQRRIIKRYSNFVPFPIELNGTVVNTVQALWTKSKSEVTDTEYEAGVEEAEERLAPEVVYELRLLNVVATRP